MLNEYDVEKEVVEKDINNVLNRLRSVNLPQAKDLLGFKRSLLFKFST